LADDFLVLRHSVLLIKDRILIRSNI
jgi:hypothetical protein